MWVRLVGARPKGPRPDLKDGPQKALLTRLNELNNPYRVSYDMVARELWSGQGPSNIQRSRTRDLSRQFRGEKAIEWRVVEVYATLLFTAADSALETELALLRELHTEAFGTTVEPDGAPSPEPEAAPVDPAYVAELEHQLEQARTRAAFATALLVIVQAENTELRGRGSSFGWFTQRPRPGEPAASAPESGSRPRGGARRSGADPARASGAGADRGAPRAGRRDAAARPDAGASRPLDPATTPIPRHGHRSGQRRRPTASRPTQGDAVPPDGRAPSYPATTPPAAPSSTLTALARSRTTASALRRTPPPEPPADDSLDVLVSHERRRRGKNRS